MNNIVPCLIKRYKGGLRQLKLKSKAIKFSRLIMEAQTKLIKNIILQSQNNYRIINNIYTQKFKYIFNQINTINIQKQRIFNFFIILRIIKWVTKQECN